MVRHTIRGNNRLVMVESFDNPVVIVGDARKVAIALKLKAKSRAPPLPAFDELGPLDLGNIIVAYRLQSTCSPLATALPLLPLRQPPSALSLSPPSLRSLTLLPSLLPRRAPVSPPPSSPLPLPLRPAPCALPPLRLAPLLLASRHLRKEEGI